MTLHFYNADLVADDGREFHATIFWDKHYPRRYRAEIYPRTGPALVGYAIWSVTGTTGRAGLTALIEKTKRKATALGLQFTSQRETEFATSLA